MAMLNIPSTNDDPSYRYKMPRLVTKIEGRGNGIKTSIVNMTDVARALKRPPTYTTKFFGCELGAQSTFTTKEGEGDRAIVNGAHDTATCQKLLDKFIDLYVLCANCHLPEIDLYVKKGIIQGACKACGWRGDLDNVHKLATFIQKNPPDGGIGFDGEKKKMDKKERQALRAEKQKGGGDDDDDESEGSDEKVKEKKDKKDKKEKKEKKSKKKDDDSDDDDGKVETNGKRGADSDSDVEELRFDSEETQDVINTLTEFVESKGGEPTVADFFEELRMQQLAKVFDHKVRLYVAVQSLFGKSIKAKEIAGKTKYLTKVISNASMSPKDILWSFEVFIVNNPAAEKTYPVTLKGLYDGEIVTEEALLEHYKKNLDTPGFATAKKAAKPFLDWLEEAESDESDSD